MNVRSLFVGLLGCLLVAPGCGAKGVGNPPEDPSSVAKTNSEKTSAGEGSTTGNTSEVGTAPKERTEAIRPDSTETNPASDKPVADKPPAEKSAPDKPVTAATASDVPEANVSIGRLEADGLVTKDIQCKSDGGGGGFGLLGMVLVTAWMSPQKKALDACAPRGQELETRVIWKAKGGKVTEIEAKGDAKVKACVEKALRPGKPVFEGFCAATVVHGKK